MLFNLGAASGLLLPPPLPIDVSLQPVIIALAGLAMGITGGLPDQKAATYQSPAACYLLLPASFSALLPGVIAPAPAETDPEPPGWPVTALPGTFRPPDSLPPRKW